MLKNIDKIKIYTSTEIELLLCCCRTKFDHKINTRIKDLLQQKINWPYLIQISKQHGVTQLLYNSLKLGHSHAVPSDILQQLRFVSHKIALNNTIFSKELLKAINLLKQHDIRAIPFKGIILAASVYGSIGLRQFCDLDILVPKQDFLNASNVLINQGGYQLSWQPNLLNQSLEISLLRKRDECSLNNGIVSIDLHQVLTAEHLLSSQFVFEDLWKRLESVSISGHEIFSFGAEDLLLYLCVHGGKECWRSLKWICDIAEFVNRYPNINWNHVMQQSKKIGCERMLLIGLLLSHEVLDINLPPVVSEKILMDPESQYLAQEFVKRLFWKNNNLSNRLTLQKNLLHLRMVDKLKDKWACLWDLRRSILQYIIKFIPNQKDQDFLSLPTQLYFFYYLIRPIRLASKILFLSKKI